MSVIVGVTNRSEVFMSSDTALTSDLRYQTGSKVFQVGSILYGVCGDLASVSAIRHGSKLPGSVVHGRSPDRPQDVDILKWAYHSVLPRLKEAMTKAKIEEPCFSVMVGVCGRLILVDENAVCEDIRPYAALGEGAPVALGALHSLLRGRQGPRDHAKIVARAVSAACAHSPSCGIPRPAKNDTDGIIVRTA